MRPNIFDVPGSKKSKNKLTAVLFFGVGIVLLALTVGASRQSQDIRERAQTPQDQLAPKPPVNVTATYNQATNDVKFDWGWGGDNPAVGGVDYCRRCSAAGSPTPAACATITNPVNTDGYKTGAPSESCNPMQVGAFWWQIVDESITNGNGIIRFYYSGYSTSAELVDFAPAGVTYTLSCQQYAGHRLRVDVATRDANGNIALGANGVPSQVVAAREICGSTLTLELVDRNGQRLINTDATVTDEQSHTYNITGGFLRVPQPAVAHTYHLTTPSGANLWETANTKGNGRYCIYTAPGSGSPSSCHYPPSLNEIEFTTAQTSSTTIGWTLTGIEVPSTPVPSITSDPTLSLGPSCQVLWNVINTSYFTSCGESNYNKIADLDKDGRVRISDFSIFRANSTNEAACTTFRNDQTDPCSNANPTAIPTPTTSVALPAPQTRRTNCDSDSSTHMICGYVFVDANNDGIRQTTEAGVAQASIAVTGGTTTTAHTIASGWFNTTNLTLASYTVTMQTPTGYAGTTRNTSSINLTVADPDSNPATDDSDGLINFGVLEGVALPTVPPVTTTVSPTTPPNPNCACTNNSCSADCASSETNGFACRITAHCQRASRHLGDANGDGNVTFADYGYYRKVVLLKTVPTEVNADFNGDGETGALDGAIILPRLGL